MLAFNLKFVLSCFHFSAVALLVRQFGFNDRYC